MKNSKSYKYFEFYKGKKIVSKKFTGKTSAVLTLKNHLVTRNSVQWA